MSKTEIGRLLENAITMDILLFVKDHPDCLKSEIYGSVTRNAHTSDRIQKLADEGLLSMEHSANGRSCRLRLTEKGERIMVLLLQADDILNGME